MSRLFFLVITIIILSFGSVVYAAKNEAGFQGSGQNTSNQIQNQNEVQTQNQGEDSQIQANTQEQESQNTIKSASPRSETAKENVSAVSQKVEKLLTTQTEKGFIGKQISQIAQEQKQAQDKIQAELEKVDGRKGLLKSLIGPNYQALKNMQKQLEQNQLRIRQLEQLKNQLTNESDITIVQETSQALVDQNTALQDQINLEEQAGSLLGWLFKLFAK